MATLNRGTGGTYQQNLNARQLVSYIGGNWGTSMSYGYDAAGRITSIDSPDNSYDRTLTYDGAGRLKTASGPWGAGSYSYDRLGNILTRVEGPRTVTINYTSANRVNQVQDTAVSSSWRSYSHDARGNVTADGLHTFAYDFANQPVTLAGTDAGSFAYDGNLKRVKQTIDGKTIYSIYDRSGAILTRDDATANEKTDFITLGGQTLVRIANGTPSYPLNDHLGSAYMVANQSGTITASNTYNFTPFGEGIGNDPGTQNKQGYTGHIEDETGLTYMQARYYDPVIGRFLSADPIGFADQLNLYAYVGNDPINRLDPNGQDSASSSSRHYLGRSGRYFGEWTIVTASPGYRVTAQPSATPNAATAFEYTVEPAPLGDDGKPQAPNTVSIDSLGNIRDLDVEEQDAKTRGPDDVAISPVEENSIEPVYIPSSYNTPDDSAGGGDGGEGIGHSGALVADSKPQPAHASDSARLRTESFKANQEFHNGSSASARANGHRNSNDLTDQAMQSSEIEVARDVAGNSENSSLLEVITSNSSQSLKRDCEGQDIPDCRVLARLVDRVLSPSNSDDGWHGWMEQQIRDSLGPVTKINRFSAVDVKCSEQGCILLIAARSRLEMFGVGFQYHNDFDTWLRIQPWVDQLELLQKSNGDKSPLAWRIVGTDDSPFVNWYVLKRKL